MNEAQRIVFPQKGEVKLESFEPDTIKSDSVRVRTIRSMISNGTEYIALHNLFDPGTHWAAYVRYPFLPGYAAVGVVDEIGADVTDLSIGDHVAVRAGHASEHVVPARECTLIPDGVPLEDANWFALAKIALMGARAANYQLGDTAVVVGAGPIGQMSVRWASAAGVTNLAVVDSHPERLKMAHMGGATGSVAARLDPTSPDLLRACAGVQPRVIVDTTGNPDVLPAALRLVADFGRLVLLGDTGTPTNQHLTSDLILRGITLVGAHDDHSETDKDFENFGDRALHELFFELARSGRFNLADLTTHQFSPSECVKAYSIATGKTNVMGILFDWR